MYYILIKARKQTIRAPIYITYAQLGYYGYNWLEPLGFVDWVRTRLYGPSNIGTISGQDNIVTRTLYEISHIQGTVDEFRIIKNTRENKRNFHDALQKKPRGIEIMDIKL